MTRGVTAPIKRTADLHDNRYLREDGSNLAALLYRLRHKEPTSYDMIVRTVRLVAPFFDDFVLEPQALNEDTIRLVWRHRGSDAYFDASSLSDGSLRFIALATLLLQPASLQPSVILLDEPELGLHPYAITVFCFARETVLRRQADRARHPVAVDRGPLRTGGCTRCRSCRRSNRIRRLEQDRLGEWLQDYSLGELWQKKRVRRAVPSRRKSGRIQPDDSTARPCRGRNRRDVRQGVARASSSRARICAGRPALDGKRAPTRSAGRSQTMGFGLPGYREPPARRPELLRNDHGRLLRDATRRTESLARSGSVSLTRFVAACANR